MSFFCKIASNVFLVLVVCLAIFACSESPQSAQKKIDKIAQTIKPKLPQILDDDTKLVNVYTKKLELISEYQLVNYTSGTGDFQATRNRLISFSKKISALESRKNC